MSPQHCKSFGHLALPKSSPAECREMVTESQRCFNSCSPDTGTRDGGGSAAGVTPCPVCWAPQQGRAFQPCPPCLLPHGLQPGVTPTLCLLLACFFPRPGRAFPNRKEAQSGPQRLNFHQLQVNGINPQRALSWEPPGSPSKSSRTDPEDQELIQRHACLQLWNSGEAAHSLHCAGCSAQREQSTEPAGLPRNTQHTQAAQLRPALLTFHPGKLPSCLLSQL